MKIGRCALKNRGGAIFYIFVMLVTNAQIYYQYGHSIVFVHLNITVYFVQVLADGEGFEPPVRLPAHTNSNRAP